MRWTGEYHIVNTATGRSLESWGTVAQADYFCNAVNDHEEKNGRPRVYVVQPHPIAWSGPEAKEPKP